MESTKRCSVDGCGRRVNARGLCGGHYWRWRTGVTFDSPLRRCETGPVEVRFWRYVKFGTGCWIWQGRTNNRGYGVAYAALPGKIGDRNYAHRVAWSLVNGPIPDRLCVLHRCDNPPCVNPSHLFLGTHADNHADMMRKGRARHPEPRRGQAVNTAKLTERDVASIRARYEAGGISQAALGRSYGVSQHAIGMIVLRKSWRHVL